MGLEELIKSLREKEQKQAEEIWQAARSEAELLRQEFAETIGDIKRKHADQLEAARQKSRRAVLSEAESKTREKKLSAYRILSRKLQAAAVKQLPGLRKHDYDEVFAELAAELPAGLWERVVVNPDDRELAARFFPAGIIETDAAVTGGFIATALEDKIVVDNTLNKRLERKWPQLLPAVIAKIEERHAVRKTAEDLA